MTTDPTDTALAEAFRHFDPEALQESLVTGAYPVACVALMHPAHFLQLAAPVATRIDSRARTATVIGVLDAGKPLSSVPELVIQVDGDQAYVQVHDGRHRAMELLKRGVTAMPVVLTVEDGVDLDGEDLDAAVFERLERIHPQPADEDEDYGGLDEDDLESRSMPRRFDVVCGARVGLAEAYRALTGREPELAAPVGFRR